MKKRIRFADFAAEIESWDGSRIALEVPNSGMMPTLRDFYDTVTIIRPQKKLKKNDVVVYFSEDGKFDISRIAFVNNGTYSLSPDGKSETEYNIPDSSIVGVMTSFDRKDRTVTADNKFYLYYLSVLPVVKAAYGFYSSLKTKAQDFIKLLLKR